MLFNRKKEKRLHSVVRRCNLILQMTRQKSRVNDNSSIRTLIFSGFKRNLEAPKQLGKTGAIFIISKEMSLKLFQRKCQLFKSRYIRSSYLLYLPISLFFLGNFSQFLAVHKRRQNFLDRFWYPPPHVGILTLIYLNSTF